MSASIGHLVVDGRIWPLACVELVEGQLRLTTVPIPGPLPDISPGAVTIFGRDGQGIAQGDWPGSKSIPRGWSMIFTYDLKVTQLV